MAAVAVLTALLLGIAVTQVALPPDAGPAVGEALPAFEARDQDGRLRTFANLRGPNGLMLVFFRSADW